MMRGRFGRLVLPLFLLGGAVLLLIRVLFPDRTAFISAEIDILILSGLLIGGMLAAVYAIVTISLGQLRHFQVRRLRRLFAAEHNRFLRRLDHELKNPLTAIRTGLSALTLSELSPQQGDIVAAMEKETVRLSRLVADLRKVADLESYPLDRRWINLSDFVGDVAQIEQERFAAADRHFSTSLIGDPAIWSADYDLLALAVHNLLDNAYKYTRPGDVVELVIAAGDSLEITVKDSGIGIPTAEMPHIYEELFRARQNEKIPGSGIGLTLVRAIIERHEGEIAVESRPDEGTTVTFWLPQPRSDQ